MDLQDLLKGGRKKERHKREEERGRMGRKEEERERERGGRGMSQRKARGGGVYNTYVYWRKRGSERER